MNLHTSDIDGNHFQDCPGCRMERLETHLERLEVLAAALKSWVNGHGAGHCFCPKCSALRTVLVRFFAQRDA